MFNIINKILFYTKIFFLLVAFSFILYIGFMKMDFNSSNVLAILPIFFPFFCLLILFVFGFFLDWKNESVYYNFTSLLALIAIIIVSIRTIFDQNIIAYPATINFSFYTMQEGRIKLLLYLMIIGNICLLYYKKRKKIKMHS